MDIDFVITWVDMSDRAWQEEFQRYTTGTKKSSNSVVDARFRDHGLLRYWFRGVEVFAPWVHAIHFVSCGQVPPWLDTTHPKLHLVHHKDIIPGDFLPTYNSGVIERYLHNIPSLAEHFVYFNDDFFLLRPVAPSRFFCHGLPCDIAAQRYNPAWAQWYKMLRNNLRLINKHFDKKTVMARDAEKWYNNKEYGARGWQNYLLRGYPHFVTLCTPHNAQPYLTETYREVWEEEREELLRTSHNRLRSDSDYTHELFRTWQICQGQFTPYNTYRDTRMFPLLLRAKEAARAISTQAYTLVCLNDNIHIRHYDKVMASIAQAFEQILPTPSSYEKEV